MVEMSRCPMLVPCSPTILSAAISIKTRFLPVPILLVDQSFRRQELLVRIRSLLVCSWELAIKYGRCRKAKQTEQKNRSIGQIANRPHRMIEDPERMIGQDTARGYRALKDYTKTPM
jgi:hypothetical protein